MALLTAVSPSLIGEPRIILSAIPAGKLQVETIEVRGISPEHYLLVDAPSLPTQVLLTRARCLTDGVLEITLWNVGPVSFTGGLFRFRVLAL